MLRATQPSPRFANAVPFVVAIARLVAYALASKLSG